MSRARIEVLRNLVVQYRTELLGAWDLTSHRVTALRSYLNSAMLELRQLERIEKGSGPVEGPVRPGRASEAYTPRAGDSTAVAPPTLPPPSPASPGSEATPQGPPAGLDYRCKRCGLPASRGMVEDAGFPCICGARDWAVFA